MTFELFLCQHIVLSKWCCGEVCGVVQKPTAATAYFTGKLLPMFAFTMCCRQ